MLSATIDAKHEISKRNEKDVSFATNDNDYGVVAALRTRIIYYIEDNR